ncbi:hypothetical protein GGR56DRAFT_648680 [Xylariaceae sp. FL0804]|nr:hypothetical protein GGR56DRAFT_648680 [Xylariaceae sp. FL0804]
MSEWSLVSVAGLRSEIDEYKAVIDSKSAKVTELEGSHAATKTQLDEAHQARELVRSRSVFCLKIERMVGKIGRADEVAEMGTLPDWPTPK